MPHVVAAPVTSRHLTHVLLQPVASVINPTQAAVCHTGTAADDIIVADQWRRSLVIDTNDPYMPVVSGLATLWFLNAIAALAYMSCDFLWLPYGTGQTIIFSCCDLFFLLFLLLLLLFFPHLVSAAADCMSIILPHMVWR